MKTTEITTIRIEADEGKMLTDGNTYGSIIFLGAGKTANDFWEISKEEYEKLMTEKEAEARDNVNI